VQDLYRAVAGHRAGMCLGVIPTSTSSNPVRARWWRGDLGLLYLKVSAALRGSGKLRGRHPPACTVACTTPGSQRLSHTFLARRCAPTPSSSFRDVMLGGKELAVSPVQHLPSLEERFPGCNLRQSLMTTPAQLVIAVALIGRPEATASPCGRRKGGTRAWAQSEWASSYLYFLPCVDAKPSRTNQCAASGCLSPSFSWSDLIVNLLRYERRTAHSRPVSPSLASPVSLQVFLSLSFPGCLAANRTHATSSVTPSTHNAPL
jgi:hypothetical protein